NAMGARYCWVTIGSARSEVLARYIPELKRNLISPGTIEKEGCIVKLQSGKIKVINGSRIVLSGTRRDNCVYSLDVHVVACELNASVEEKNSLAQVCHKRLGHISEAGLQVLEKQGLFGKKSLEKNSLAQVCHKRLGHISEAGLHVLEKQGLFGKKSLGKLDFCENCVLGKSHRVSFGVGMHTTQGVIDYVHSDLWGPSQVESLGGKRYFLSIVDDYSIRVWVYLFRFKHEAFEKFKEWKQLVENQTGKTVKKLRTDNGLEFCNWEFKQLCIESGIARHLTVAGTPQQNGLAEPIEKKTPMGMWSGHPSDYGMLRTFSCVAYSHVEQVACEDSSKWKAAMKEEMDSLRKNKTWELGDHQAGQKMVTCKWLFKIKEGIEGVQKPRYKARLVARRFTQRASINYNEVFSPVVRYTSIRVILALTACKDCKLEQLDVKTAFLHGNLEEVIYMRQPPG
nr:retrovirus-related Pol polyprotein from transposon TNT 1-94 [Tanacetum cinerariifolium]